MMSNFISKLWFPLAVVSAISAQMASSHRDVETNEDIIIAFSGTEPLADTVKYPLKGYQRYWTEEEKNSTFVISDSLKDDGSDLFGLEEALSGRPEALDTLIAPDSLLQLDTFFYKYYAAIKDSLSHMYIRDSLIAAGDSLDWPRIDSLYAADSAAVAEAAYWKWYESLDKKERKKADFERMIPIRQAMLDSIRVAKDSIQAYKDSVIQYTPRILESYVFRDSLRYQRILKWTHEQDFHRVHIIDNADTSYNYRFYDSPFLREDVNATWLGVSGSPVQYFDFSKRKSNEGVFFYDAQESWSFSPSTLPMYNSKTPYTELAYWGTLLAASSKESDNVHILTTQNVTPAFNYTLSYDRFGGNGVLAQESTTNKTATVRANYMGKKYMMHAGYIYNMVSRQENGGITDNTMIRDTTIDAREINVYLSNASSKIKKNTVFVDQQYRIPFYFIDKWLHKDASDTLAADLGPEEGALEEAAVTEDKDKQPVAKKPAAKPKPLGYDGEDAPDDLPDDLPEEIPEGEEDAAAADTLKIDDANITTAFIGHSSEFSTYRRIYDDQISTETAREFYNNTFYLNPTTTHDSLRVMKLDNRVFVRLQPWSEDGIVSKLDVGAGEKILNYYKFDNSFLYKPSNYTWTSTYLYAGIEGKFKKYIDWDARGHYSLIGDEANDFDISANANLKIYPFRRAKDSPIIINAHFGTSLDEPEYYVQHIFTNHFRWDNDFGKSSLTEARGGFSIPRWNLGAEATYSLLSGNIYYDTDGIVRQNSNAMSILSASLYKNFTVARRLHFDHRGLFQLSSNEDVVPLPMVALNARYYIQFAVGENDALHMQIGVNAWYNTAWYTPSWNPELGVFHNQTDVKYGNAPYFDAFVNMQWKRACIFVKLENAGMGWPLDKADYFSANHFIRTQRAVKFGMFWPFYTQPGKQSASESPEDVGN